MAGIDLTEQLRRAVLAVARRRCPQCGRGRAFDGWWRLKSSCSECGRRFQQHPGSITGVMQMGAMAVVIFALVSWFIIAAVFPLSINTSLAALIGSSTLFGVWFFPYAKLLWEAVDCVLDAMNGDDQEPGPTGR